MDTRYVYNEENLNGNYPKTSTIILSAYTILDKDIATSKITINWLRPEINITNNPNSGKIVFDYNEDIDYKLDFNIGTDDKCSYVFKPNLNHVGITYDYKYEGSGMSDSLWESLFDYDYGCLDLIEDFSELSGGGNGSLIISGNMPYAELSAKFKAKILYTAAEDYEIEISLLCKYEIEVETPVTIKYKIGQEISKTKLDAKIINIYKDKN